MPTRIKICGITRPEDAALAAELGADAIGLNFVGGPRKIDPHLARTLLRSLPPLVTPVALVSADAADAPQPHELYNALRVFIFQIYAKATPHWTFYENECAYWWVRHIDSREALASVAVEWGSRTSVQTLSSSPDWRYPPTRIGENPEALLLDTASNSALGGIGQTFNWNWIVEARAAGELEGLPPIILAGGLTPDNVAEAIRIAKPYAVDVSSGVEVKGQPGVKDAIKMRDFIQAAKAVP